LNLRCGTCGAGHGASIAARGTSDGSAGCHPLDRQRSYSPGRRVEQPDPRNGSLTPALTAASACG
jgi:hypothetical protein